MLVIGLRVLICIQSAQEPLENKEVPKSSHLLNVTQLVSGRAATYAQTNVCLSSGCYNNIPRAEWLKQQTLISGGWEVWDQGASMLSFWWKSFSWLADSCLHAFLLCLHMAERDSEREHMKWVLVSSSFYKGTNLIEGALTSWPESPPGGFISNTTTMGIRVSTYGPWRDKNIGSVTTLKPTCSMGNPRWSRRHQVLVHFFSIVE